MGYKTCTISPLKGPTNLHNIGLLNLLILTSFVYICPYNLLNLLHLLEDFCGRICCSYKALLGPVRTNNAPPTGPYAGPL